MQLCAVYTERRNIFMLFRSSFLFLQIRERKTVDSSVVGSSDPDFNPVSVWPPQQVRVMLSIHVEPTRTHTHTHMCSCVHILNTLHTLSSFEELQVWSVCSRVGVFSEIPTIKSLLWLSSRTQRAGRWLVEIPPAHWPLTLSLVARSNTCLYAVLMPSNPQNFQRFSKLAPTPVNSCLNVQGSRPSSVSTSVVLIWKNIWISNIRL